MANNIITTGGQSTVDIADVGGDTVIWDADISGTYDWQAGGVDSVDPTSGLIARGDVTDATTFEVGSNAISIDISGSGSDKVIYLERSLASLGIDELRSSSSVAIVMDVNFSSDASNMDTYQDRIWVEVRNDQQSGSMTEAAGFYIRRNGIIEMYVQNTINNAYSQGVVVTVVNWTNAARISCIHSPANRRVQFYEGTGPSLTSAGILTDTAWHCRPGANSPPHFYAQFRAMNGGQVKLDITGIRVIMA